MRNITDRVIELTDQDLSWPFENDKPVLYTRQRSTWPSAINIDPFPAYAHDVALVRDVVGIVEERFPIAFCPDYYLPHFEIKSRTNGYTSRDWNYNEGQPRTWEPYIVLSGKRIPPHPAMTRYLVAHEYGHVVNFWLDHKRGIADGSNAFRQEYAAIRGIEANFRYGARRWHSNIGEILANDFRIVVCGIEPEFWPHTGVAYPTDVNAIIDFWAKETADAEAEFEFETAKVGRGRC